MHSQLSAQQRAFVDEVETFLRARLPPDLAERVKRGRPVPRTDLAAWTRALDERGWAAPHWPVEHGGTGWSLVQRQLFDNACRAAHAPPLSGFGFNMVGPAIIRFGTPEQQREFLPRIRRGELWWCQGYSEPEAGSDLASVRTRAVRDGDDYVVDGRKIWTSAAEEADWIFCLVRTNPDVQAQRGISFLLMDLRSPGIEITPLLDFNGKRLWNQVFFHDVRVPVANRLGAEDKGWTVAKALLGDERLMVSRVAENRRVLTLVEEALAGALGAGTGGDDLAGLRGRIGRLRIRLQALETSSLRLLTVADRGGQVGAEPSMLKLLGSTLVQAQDELLAELVGHWLLPADSGSANRPVGPAWTEYVASGMFHHRGYTIAGGTSEVQHNIIAREVLGL
jgi:alkylation response protein AidB-like acyl-CoA dehydrogenase